MKEANCLDDFLRLGRYSTLVCITCELIILLQAGNLMFMVFGGATPKLSGCVGQSTNITQEDEICRSYHNQSCEPIIHSEFTSINIEWNLLCQNGKRVKDSTSFQMVGYMMGTLVFGQISDVYGRKWPMFVCLLLTGILGVASAFSTDIFMFTIIRTLLSFFNTGHIVIVVVFMCETFPKHHRMWLNFVFSWSPNLVLVTLLAYLSAHWRTYALVLNSLAFVACGLLYFTHESIYWYIRKGRNQEAFDTIQKIAKFDGRVLDKQTLERVLETERKRVEGQSTGSYYFHHLFCSWTLVSYTITMICSYFAVAIINYGIMFNLETLSGSLYFNLLCVGILRVILNIFSAVCDFKFAWLGRRTAHFIFAAYAAASVAVIIGMHLTGLINEHPEITRFVVISASSVASQIFITNQVTTSEIYPTPIRNVAYAMTQLSGSTGSIFGPQLFTLVSLSPVLPFIVIISLQIFESILFFICIPESKGQPLCEKMPKEEERILSKRKGRVTVTTDA